MKKKIEPTLINSREALEAVVADVVKLKIEHTQATAAMEVEIAAVQKRHQESLLNLSRQIESKESGVVLFCQRNRAALFPEKKSLETLLAVIGFETTPPRVEKLKKRDTWGQIALRLQALVWGKKYARTKDPEVDKEQLISDRAAIKPEDLAGVGLAIEQDEQFFIRPKSAVAEATVQKAA